MRNLHLIKYELLAISASLVYLYVAGIWCNLTNLCSILFIDIYLIHKLLVYFVFIPFIIQKIICRIIQPRRDDFLTIGEFCQSRGYKLETIKIVTEDNYHIGMHHLINPHFDKVDKEPLILWHGLGGSSYQWLITSATGRAANWVNNNNGSPKLDDSLAITLSNHGYDVFLPNLRGNEFSFGHSSLNPDKHPIYWDYGIDEMIKYDCPAAIDKVLELTGKEKTAYVGVSMGGMIALGLLSDRPEYNAKISVLTTIGSPIRCLNSNIGSFFSLKYKNIILTPICKYILKNPGPVLPPLVSSTWQYLVRGNLFANTNDPINVAFKFYLNRTVLWFFGSRTLNPRRASEIGSQVYISFSRKTVAHILQLSMATDFQKFDNYEKNKRNYGSDRPPFYNVKNIKVPAMSLIYAKDDQLISFKDGLYLRDQLTIPVNWFPINKKNYDHYDLILGDDAGNIVNSKVLKSLTRP